MSLSIEEINKLEVENTRLKNAMRPLLREVKGLHSRCPKAGCTRLGWVEEAEAALAEGGSDAHRD